jgi:hypothetical protein
MIKKGEIVTRFWHTLKNLDPMVNNLILNKLNDDSF